MADQEQRIFYKGIVCSEPTGLGGIKIRVPELHGIPNVSVTWLPSDQLPYAYPASQISADDFGQKMAPLIGTQVYVAYFDKSRFLYFGSAIPSTNYSIQTQMRDVFFGENIRLNQPQTIEIAPFETVVFKSLKGSSIEISDQDINEYIRIVGPQGGYIQIGNQGLSTSRRGKVLSTFRANPTEDNLSSQYPLDTYIHIDDGKGNNIHIDREGTITINCKKFKVNAEESDIQGL